VRVSTIREPLLVGRPNIGDKRLFMQLMDGMFERRWLSNNGVLVQRFEECIASHLGVKHCVATCNGTVALEIAIAALQLSGEVIVPSFTFIATAHALTWQGITPIFADVDPRTHTLDPDAVRRAITPETTAILGVHLWGRPADIEALHALAKEHGLKLFFDAAHAFGCSYRGTMIGNFGACEVFSFHATKFLNSFEGGAIATNDDAIAEAARAMRNFGLGDVDEGECAGTNGKMVEACAAMGLVNLESIDAFIATNQRNYCAYQSQLADVTGLRLYDAYDAGERHNYQYVVLEVQPEFGATRDDVMSALREENIFARKYFWPGCHRMQPYRTLYPDLDWQLPNTLALADRVLILPTGTATDPADIHVICNVIRAQARSDPSRVRVTE
jgi:dTDP-4-amino-4,6-dideoxygalactose transaminase